MASVSRTKPKRRQSRIETVVDVEGRVSGAGVELAQEVLDTRLRSNGLVCTGNKLINQS